MKRIFTMMLVSFLLIGCDSGVENKVDTISDKVYSHAVEVVEIVDEYLSDIVSWNEVNEKVLNAEIKYETEKEKEIEKAILKVWEDTFVYFENKEEVINARNDLALLIDIDLIEEVISE